MIAYSTIFTCPKNDMPSHFPVQFPDLLEREMCILCVLKHTMTQHVVLVDGKHTPGSPVLDQLIGTSLSWQTVLESIGRDMGLKQWIT